MDAKPHKIMIVGLGWLGWPLALALKGKGHRVTGTTRSGQKQQEMMKEISDVEVWTYDPSNPSAPSGISEADMLIITLPPAGNHANWHAAIRLLCSSVRHDATIIFTSTTGVYRMGLEGGISVATEDMPLKDSPLLTAEQLVQSSGRPYVILRLAGLVGGDRRASRFLAGKTGVKSPNAPVNLVHCNDVIKAVRACIERKVCYEVINVCSDIHPSKKEYYTRMAIQAGLEPPQFLEEDGGGYVVDNAKLKVLLGLEFEFPDPYHFE